MTALALAAATLLGRLLPIGVAYQAKLLCSSVFVAGREPADVLATDLDPASLHPLLNLIRTDVDPEARRVRASFLGLVERQAVFRPGQGSVVAIGGPPVDLGAPPHAPQAGPAAADAPWPAGERVGPLDAGGALAAAVAGALAEPDPARLRRTRAVVVVHRGRIVAEGYAPGFAPDTPLLGWSVTKTVTAALVGVLVGEGRWALDQPVPVPEWADDDPRAAITLEQLLQMRSGLEFREEYGDPLADVTTMLFASRDAGGFAAAKPLVADPGARWSYASGTTNLLCRAMAAALGPRYASFPRRALFDPLGMRSAVLEADAGGHFVGSSFGWATARDWARLGLLWLQDGVWEGRRLLPAGWVAFCTREAPGSAGHYGGHLWLKIPAGYRAQGPAPTLPADAFHAVGHEGQFVSVVPSRQVVVVRLGLTRGRHVWDHAGFLQGVLAALPVDE